MPKKTHNTKAKKTQDVEEVKPVVTEETEEEPTKTEIDPDLVDSMFEEPIEPDEEDEEDDGFGSSEEEEEPAW